MEENNNLKINIGSSWPIILFIIFFLAKIFNKIDWSWIWIFSPLWISFGFGVSVIGIFLILRKWIN